MEHKIELLAPGGDVDAIKAAIAAGANAVYCGLDKFNARNRAANISFEELLGIIHLAHKYQCEVFLALNIIVVDAEFPALVNLLNKLVNTAIDGVIVQDLGLIYLLNQHFKTLRIHASTQLTTHNKGQIQFLNTLQIERVNLSRELNLTEINDLTHIAHSMLMKTEVFVHGSNCISFSGLCYMSSVHGGNSGNRGRCSQPCRDAYQQTITGYDFPLNMKDNSAFENAHDLAMTKVDSFKIEGRIKQFHYVYAVVDTWRKQLDQYENQHTTNTNKEELYRVFNRDFTNGYINDSIGNEMFIDNPRDHSALYLAQQKGGINEANIEWAKKTIYNNRTELIAQVREKIEKLSIDKVPLELIISGKVGSPLKIRVKSAEVVFEVESDQNLKEKGTEVICEEFLFKRLKAINELNYNINKLSLNLLQPNVYLSFKSITALRNKLLYFLNNSMELVSPVELPKLKQTIQQNEKSKLALLISDELTLQETKDTTHKVYFELPNGIHNQLSNLVLLFKENQHLIPWFPSILIGDDYFAALEFLHQVKPKQIVSNNLGLAHAAYQQAIDWIAGPYLNIVNSFALMNLMENFNCKAAFISNELNKAQIRSIKPPTHFQLHFSLFQPIELMTSRQCLFQQVSGCIKNKTDKTCLQHCAKTASLSNLKDELFLLDKSKGNYCKIYDKQHYLNTEILKDLPNKFAEFLIDLRKVKTNTKIAVSCMDLASLFQNAINNTPNSFTDLHKTVQYSNCIQYRKGI